MQYSIMKYKQLWLLVLSIFVYGSGKVCAQLTYVTCSSTCPGQLVGHVTFANKSGTTTGRWTVDDLAYGGLTNESFTITDPASFTSTNGNLTSTGGGTYTIVSNPNTVNGPTGTPLVNKATDGVFLFRPNNSANPFAVYKITGLQPNGKYCVRVKMRNAATYLDCNQSLYTTIKFKSLTGLDISGGGVSNGMWNRVENNASCNQTTSGTWDGNNQTYGLMWDEYASWYECNFQLGQNPNNTNDDGFTLNFQANAWGNNDVWGIDEIEVYGCITQQLISSNGSSVCEATPTTLTAQGIGATTDTYVWQQSTDNGSTFTPVTASSSNTLDITPSTKTIYSATCTRTNLTVKDTLTPVNCCGPTGLFTIPKVCESITVDGNDNEPVWYTAPWQNVTQALALNDIIHDCVSGSCAGVQENPAGQWRCVYTPTDIYFDIRVIDDNPQNAGSVYYQDGVEIYIANKNNTALQFGYTYANGTPGFYQNNAAQNGTAKIVKNAAYWDLEVRIPIAANNIDLTPGYIKMELGINQAKDGCTCRAAQLFTWIAANHYAATTQYHTAPLSDCAGVKASKDTVCSGGSTILTTQLSTVNAGLPYSWQQSTDNGSTWTALAGTTNSITVTPTVQTQYRVIYDNVTSCPVTIYIGSLSFSVTNPPSVCSPATVDLTAAAVTAGSQAGLTYTYFTDATATNALANANAVATGNTYYIKGQSASCYGVKPVTVTIYPATSAGTLSGTQNVCINNAVTFSSTQAGGTWTSSDNNITFLNSSTGAITGKAVGTATITYTVNGTNGCPNATATRDITVNPLPIISGTTTVTAGSTAQLTGDGLPAGSTPWTSSNTGVATIDNTGKISAITAGTTTITYTNSNGCQKTVTVTVTNLPTITGNLSVCLNKTTQLTGSPTAAASNAWVSSNTLVATISNSGLVTAVSVGTSKIIYTNSNADTVSAVITVNDLPTITGTLAVSTGSTSQLTGSATAAASNAWVSSNTSVATIDNTGLVSGLADGTTTITYTNSNGCTITAVVSVSSNPIISGKLNVCVNGTTQLTATTPPATPTAWSSSDLSVATVDNTGLVSGTASGTATITYTNAAGNSTTASIIVNALPSVTGKQNLCLGDTSTYFGTGIPSNNAWTSSNPLAASINQTNGKVLAIGQGSSAIGYTDNNGCSNILTITINPHPSVNGAAELCQGSISKLTATGTPAASNAWVSSNISAVTIDNAGNITGNAGGNSIITFTDNNGCTDTMAITVDLAPSAPAGTPTQPSCTTATGSITVTSPASGVTYSFDNGNSYQASATVGNLLPNTYQLVVKSIAGGCISSSQSVTINQPPVIPQAPAANITQTSCTSATGTIAASSTTPNVEYSFDNGATFQPGGTSSALVAGTYQVLVKEISGGCVSTATTAIINTQPTAPADPQLNIVQPTCTNTNGFITVVNAQNNATYSFDNGVTYQTSATSGALSQGNYQVIGKSNAGGCLSNAAPAPINAPPAIPPAPTVGNNGIVKYCQQDLAQPLTANGTNLTWYNSFGASIGTTAPTPLTDQGGSTTYYVTSSNGICESPRTGITVTVSAVSAYAGGPVVAVEEGKSARLNGQASGTGTLTISWSPATYLNRTDIDTPTVTPLKDKLYTMKVTTADGCSDTSSVQVLILKIPVIPNAFSPNGDGINDKWVITNLEGYEGSTVSIFNRYGQLLYEVAGLSYSNNAWDGTVHGNPVPVGTYYYIIKLTDGRKPISGSISVIR
ncbi:Ig-like domain-containing protein [Ferruginibacter albus]|uniref:Ig-like domain-containing protein n=1 Tax=Ferruginibacter albus TaxID=2875540 RepID=UPI001CC6B39E|nr:Ig-like domain-containing protein [Ferruginibacter albus]UAY51209.1 Ig-like domain-containing protein [Ferruginibacter albus]